MLASLLRPNKRREYAQRSPFLSPHGTHSESRWPWMNGDAAHEHGAHRDAEDESIEDEDADGDDEDAQGEASPLLPIFSAPHLGIVIWCRNVE